MSGNDFWNKLQILSVQWYLEKNEEKKKKLENLIFEKLFYQLQLDGELLTETQQEVQAFFSEFYYKRMKNFDPFKASIKTYFYKTKKFYEKEKYKQMMAQKEKMPENKNDDENTEDFYLNIEDKAISIDGCLFVEEITIQLLSIIIEIVKHGSKDKRSRQEMFYFTLFYTDFVSRDVRFNHNPYYKSKEKEVINNVQLDFWDFTLINRCRTIDELMISKLKPHEEMVSGSTSPIYEFENGRLPGDIYIQYIALFGKDYIEKVPNDSTITERLQKYKMFVSKAIAI